LASLEGRIFCSGDLDLFPGPRIAAGTGGTLAHLEGAEADQADVLAGLQRAGDRADHGVDRAPGVSLGQAGVGRDGVDQFILVHWTANSLRGQRPLDDGGRIAPADAQVYRPAWTRCTCVRCLVVAAVYTSGVWGAQYEKTAENAGLGGIFRANRKTSMLDIGGRRGLACLAPDLLHAFGDHLGRERALKREVEDFVDPLHRNDLERLGDVLRDVGQVLAVLVGDDHRAHAAAQRRQQLLLEPA